MPAHAAQARDEDPDKTPVERGRDLERDSERARKRYHSTLVGHPTDGAAAPPVPAGSVLSPPRWRGAQAYQGGDDPQPQVSSLPAPAGVPQPPPLPATDARPVIGPDGKPITRVSSPPPAPPSEPLGERIEELLDGQASVPMDEVEERRSSVTELAIEDVIEAFSDPDLEPAPVVSPPPAPAPVARIKLRPAAQAPIGLAEDATVVELDSRRQRAEAPPEPEASEPPPLPEPIAVSEPADREERAALPEIAPPAPEVVSSLAPAEVEKQQESERSSVGFVIAAVAAMAVIGVGGWWLTRGTYEPAPRAETPIVKPPPAAAAAVAPKHAPPAAEEPTQPEAPVEQPAPVANKKVRKPKRAPKATRAAAPAPAEPEAQAPAEAPEPALQVKPRNTELPDTPSRDAVVAALSKVQRAVRACAPGQRGVAQVDLTVSGVGKVTHAIVGGDFAGTPEGSCIARAVRAARFTPFKQPRFRVVYPFSL